MPTGHDELLLPREVASIFRVTTRTLWNWEQRGVLVPVRLPTGQKRYRRNDVEALLQAFSGKGTLLEKLRMRGKSCGEIPGF
ncbi:MerR family transcriptional regulator [Moorella naiadis]|uniref:MerR family transcriptional regulator n=1 Tax=Moorella naiadis (nom. illeg.) TaxID=3093670 RepID=UPI003D9C8FB7